MAFSVPYPLGDGGHHFVPGLGLDYLVCTLVSALHAAIVSHDYFSNHNISLLPRSANSADLNPIENLWGILVRDVYKDNRQYNSVQELMEEINRCWNNIDQKVVKNLYKSMPKRIANVLKAQGLKTKY